MIVVMSERMKDLIGIENSDAGRTTCVINKLVCDCHSSVKTGREAVVHRCYTQLAHNVCAAREYCDQIRYKRSAVGGGGESGGRMEVHGGDDAIN